MVRLFYVNGLKGDDALDCIVRASGIVAAALLWRTWLTTISDEPWSTGIIPYRVNPIPHKGTTRVIPWSEFDGTAE